MLAEEPCVSLAACEPCAVNSRLLACAYADSLSVICKTYGVGLCVLECDECDDEIAYSFLRQVLLCCDNVAQQLLIDPEEIVSLLECNAEYHLGLLLRRHVVRVDLDDVVAALSLGLQQLERFVSISRSDDAVRNLSLDELCSRYVADVRQSYPVTERAHSVGSSCSCISACERRLVESLDVVNEAGLLELFRQNGSYCCARRADVLEAGSCRHAKLFLELLDELP